ncbi:MAG: YfcE family phosphodiesterase [Ruminococcus sp.]|nr:YfcE family phosphodiesterase [Ruminococcus sp.]
MRVVVFSDTHGNGIAIDKIVEKNKDVTHFIFLGDGMREIESAVKKYPDKEFHIVCGNCDSDSLYPDTGFLELCGKKIMFTHGHRYYVNFSLDKLITNALYNNAHIVCFGHLHERVNNYFNGIYILNPSSASCPRDGKKPAYAYIDIEESGIFIAHVDL